MSSYYLLQIKDVPRTSEELLSLKCFELGAMGVSEDLKFRQTAADYEPETIESDILSLNVYFETAPLPESLQELKAFFPEIKFELSEEEEKDWLEEWKKGFEAFALVDDVWIVPSWLKAPPEAKQIIAIDPGMAFGTGTHATTQLASGVLAHWKSQMKPALSELTLLDVGTGTGVLAILGEILGFASIDATEIEPMARQVAKENVERNNCKSVSVLDVQVEDIKTSYDFVIANIIDGILLRISSDLKSRVKPRGFLLLTGIIEERAEGFLEGFIGKDAFETLLTTQKGEWKGYLLQRLR